MSYWAAISKSALSLLRPWRKIDISGVETPRARVGLPLQASPRRARQAQIMAAITKKPDIKTAHNDSSEPCRSENRPDQDTPVLPAGEKDMKRTGCAISRRQEQLAQPREPAALKT